MQVAIRHTIDVPYTAAILKEPLTFFGFGSMGAVRVVDSLEDAIQFYLEDYFPSLKKLRTKVQFTYGTYREIFLLPVNIIHVNEFGALFTPSDGTSVETLVTEVQGVLSYMDIDQSVLQKTEGAYIPWTKELLTITMGFLFFLMPFFSSAQFRTYTETKMDQDTVVTHQSDSVIVNVKITEASTTIHFLDKRDSIQYHYEKYIISIPDDSQEYKDWLLAKRPTYDYTALYWATDNWGQHFLLQLKYRYHKATSVCLYSNRTLLGVFISWYAGSGVLIPILDITN